MRIGLRSGVRSGVAKGDHKLIQLTSNLAQSLRLEPGGRFSPVRWRRGGSMTTSLHISSNSSAS